MLVLYLKKNNVHQQMSKIPQSRLSRLHPKVKLVSSDRFNQQDQIQAKQLFNKLQKRLGYFRLI